MISSLSCALVGLAVSLVPYLVLVGFKKADRSASAVSGILLLFAAAILTNGPPQELDPFLQLLLGNALAALGGHLLGQAVMRLRRHVFQLPFPLF